MSQTSSSQPSRTVKAHKRGANSNETASKPRKHDKNFSQSKDIHEDRSVRQRTMGHKK